MLIEQFVEVLAINPNTRINKNNVVTDEKKCDSFSVFNLDVIGQL
jgi:hypothetical protein